MWFSMIDVAKHQLELRKGAKNKLLTLTNEVKIITSSDETFKLWQEVISCAAQGDLIDVNSKELTKFKDHKNFESKKDGVLTREFFKFLGNLSEADHAKLCRHILNPSGPSLSHPLQVPPLWYIPLNGGNRTKAFNLALARVTMHQPNMGHTHVRLALNLLCHQSKLGTYPLSPLVHPLVNRGWLGADFHTCPRPS